VGGVALIDLKTDKDGVIVPVFVLPKSSRNMVSGVHNGALKLKIKAPPVDNAANKMCVTYLAKCLKIPKSSIEITAGHTSRNKQLMIKSDEGSQQNVIKQKILDLAQEKT
jgi:uncharacterized protein